MSDITQGCESPVSAALAAAAGVQFQDLILDGDNVYWSERRPAEGGRTVILRYASSTDITECLPTSYNVGTRVHEYGRGAFAVDNDIIYFINDSDQRLYIAKLDAQGKCLTSPEPLTNGSIRLADLHMTPHGLVAVAESSQESSQPENSIVLIHVATGEIQTLVRGVDFYASLAVSKDSSKIAWIAWSHPNMPWNNTTCWMADLTKQGVKNSVPVDPETTAHSFFQPQWDNQNQLWVVSDRTNWWNLYRVGADHRLEPVIMLEGEIGQPLWVFGLSTWGFYDGGILFCHSVMTGGQRLAYYKEGAIRPFDLPFVGYSHLRIGKKGAYCFVFSSDQPSALVHIDLSGKVDIIRKSSELSLAPETYSKPMHIAFESEDRQVYAYFYAPQPKQEEKPPLLVMCHGGPTAQASAALDLGIQYWTTRGFAVLDVNYTGSTGYGRAFRESLAGRWGEVDVKDCEAGVDEVIRRGWVDPQRVVIVGGSAGGLTVLLALAHSQRFCAGSVLYGVTDLANLLQDTHKFESHYLEWLVGVYPKEKARYEARSPVNHVKAIRCPVIFFHGEDDPVVPLSQAQHMVNLLEVNGVDCEWVVFPGERHGFRQAAHRAAVLERQYAFFMKCFDRQGKRNG